MRSWGACPLANLGDSFFPFSGRFTVVMDLFAEVLCGANGGGGSTGFSLVLVASREAPEPRVAEPKAVDGGRTVAHVLRLGVDLEGLFFCWVA